MLKRTTLFPAALASLALSTLPVAAATFDVTSNLWGDVSTPNTFAWAIQQANANSGADVIRLFSDVNVDQGPITTDGFLTELTDKAGLNIQGNGHALVGNPLFFRPSIGAVVDKKFPKPYNSSTDDLLIPAYSFARISDNVSNVTVDGLTVDGLNAFLDVGEGSVATITNSTIRYAVSWPRTPRPVITAKSDSTVNLTDVYIHNINPFQELSFGTEYIWSPALLGNNATLNMLKSKIDLYFTSTTAGAVAWNGGTANIVSSLIFGQGLSIADLNKQGVLNFVNSVFRPAEDSATARIQAFYGGVANIIASTLQYDALETNIPNFQFCTTSLYYPCNGAPLQAFAEGEINLLSSAISVLNEDLAQIQYPYLNQFNPQNGAPSGGLFTADSYSYVKPVINQDAATLKSLFGQPNLITAGDAYVLVPSGTPRPTYGELPAGATPKASGPLIGVVPDADNLNKLINPIDGNEISTDVFGNPRTFNGKRDVGAVQTPGPLPVLGCGAAFGWSRRLRRRIRQ